MQEEPTVEEGQSAATGANPVEGEALPLRKTITVRTEGQAQITLGLSITQLRIDGFDPSEILVLSYKAKDALVHRTKEVVPELGEFLVPYVGHEEAEGVIRFAHFDQVPVSRWPAVLITDAYDLANSHEVDLLARERAEALAERALVTITLDPEVESGMDIDLQF